MQSVFSSNRTELNVGQETLSLIDYIDENFPILHKNIFEWDLLDVSNWLKHIGLEQYVTIFQNNHIIGKNLFDIKEQELKEDFQMISVGHRKNLLHSIEYLNKIYIENKGRRMSIIRNKLAQFYYKKGNQINWKTKKVKSLCDVIEEEDDNNENNLKSLPEEHEINEKYKALRKELWNSKIRNKKNSMDSSIGVEENKKELFPIQDELKSILGRKNTKSGTPLEKSPSLLGEEIKDEVYDDRKINKISINSFFLVFVFDYFDCSIIFYIFIFFSSYSYIIYVTQSIFILIAIKFIL